MFTTTTDKTLTCSDCSQEFAFTASEQQFYADRQFSEPRRCPSCLAIRKAARGENGAGGGNGFSSGGYDRGPREMFSAMCASCGREAQVPIPTEWHQAGLLPRLLRDAAKLVALD
jgi:DNA-directed RNA polymerase subunit RPC12/RpoP